MKPTRGWQYSKGLHDIGEGCYAYLQPDGSWGWSNAGLIVDDDASMLVDTLFDLAYTEQMLNDMKSATRAALNINTLVNTHGNGDHCYGNQLVAGAEIVGTEATAEEMRETPPDFLHKNMKMAGILKSLPWQLSKVPMGKNMSSTKQFGQYLEECFGKFDFSAITLTPPDRTFTGSLSIVVGNRSVELIEVGPAHSKGDTLVYDPTAKTVFTGDILFVNSHPIIWEGPISNWLAACDRLLDLDIEVVVPGHGPITDKDGVRRIRSYLEYIHKEARDRFDAGMSVFDAAMDITFEDYDNWGEAERIVVNLNTLYKEFSGDIKPTHPRKLFALMANVAQAKRH